MTNVVIILIITNVSTLICLLFLVFHYKVHKKIFLKIICPKISEPKYSKSMFLKKINHKGKLLDVGCGNNSPYFIKTEYPEIIYTGIDVGDYNQIKPNLADNYIVVEPEQFAETIANMPELFDTVISSHNLEHCNERQKTLEALSKVLKSGGFLYLSFPSERSVNFPGFRNGCLNYYDDSSHKDVPPNFNNVLDTLNKNNMEIIFASKSYKPFFMYLIGALNERESKRKKETKKGTWAYWGFEAIIWARKK